MKTITVYVTKYALTRGILRMKIEPSETYPDMVSREHDHFHGDGRWPVKTSDLLAMLNPDVATDIIREVGGTWASREAT